MNDEMLHRVQQTRSKLRKRPSNTHFHRRRDNTDERDRLGSVLSPVPSGDLSEDVSTILKRDIWKETLGQYLGFQHICRATHDMILPQAMPAISPNHTYAVRSLRQRARTPQTRRRNVRSPLKKNKISRKNDRIKGSNKFMTTNDIIEFRNRSRFPQRDRNEDTSLENVLTSLDILDADDESTIQGLDDPYLSEQNVPQSR